MEQPLALVGLAAALLVAVIGLAVALRFLYKAWSDVYLRRNRRTGGDRRQEDLPVPMERRRRPDRRL
ncbi:MAG TPA: hypothetical protein VLB51_04690 [Methylomirabilota bacterium]|nr:hypothetical protein [Methylomirabilota bacterium]